MISRKEVRELQTPGLWNVKCFLCKEQIQDEENCMTLFEQNEGSFDVFTKDGDTLKEISFHKDCWITIAGKEWLFEE